MGNLDAKEDLPYQDFRNIRESNPEQEDQDVHSAMEPPY
jgi:hypothetical protein